MEASNFFVRIRRTSLFGLIVTCCVYSGAFAQHVHKQHGGMSSSKLVKSTELGTSAAIDKQGRLWISGKETTVEGDYVVLQMSEDMGKTWSVPNRLQHKPESAISADGENRPKLAFGPKGEIYVSYTRPLSKPYTAEIRFVRSIDGGKNFSAPIVVHANRDVITHRFESMVVDREGRIYVAWIDKRDMEAAKARNEKYAGAAVYYAVSEDSGVTFKGDYKIADHSCECCRIALALRSDGKPVAMWRHVFAPNARDHALAVLSPDGSSPVLSRVTFEDWRVDACPHHGPALAYAADGVRYQAWFNVKGDEGGVFYASAAPSGALGKPVRLGDAQAKHADVAVQGKSIVFAWKQFDGKSTAILARVSRDGGKTWSQAKLAHTDGGSDQPRLVSADSGIYLIWRTQNEGVRSIAVKEGR